MNDHVDLKPVLDFLKGIEKNNNKPWFEKNRRAYEESEAQFAALVDKLIAGLSHLEDLSGVMAKDCVMRIYRDIRFSKDKSPYKISRAASIRPGGKKSQRLAYYIHVEPHDRSVVAGGLHDPESSQIAKFREAIGRNARGFKAIINDKKFKGYFGAIEGEKLKTAPQGFARDHPEIELLRFKEVVAIHRLTDEMVLSPKFSEHVLQAFMAMKPFLDYLNSVVE